MITPFTGQLKVRSTALPPSGQTMIQDPIAQVNEPVAAIRYRLKFAEAAGIAPISPSIFYSIPDWNDATERTFAEVKAAFQKADL